MDRIYEWFHESRFFRRAGALLLAFVMMLTTVSGVAAPAVMTGAEGTEASTESALEQIDQAGDSDPVQTEPESPEPDETGVSEPQSVAGVLSEDGKTLSFESFVLETVGGAIHILQIRVEAELSAFPEGTEMTVKSVKGEDFMDAAAEAVQGEVASVHAVDITFRDTNGEEIQPSAPVKVMIQSPLLEKEEAMPDVVHIDDSGKTPQAALVEETVVEDDTLTLETDSFSVYALVYVEYYYRDCQGDTYHITVTFDRDAGIPSDAQLEVTELLPGTEGYEAYVNAAAATLDSEAESFAFAHAFDISLIDPATGKPCQPDQALAVSIRLLNEDIQEGDSIDVVHFPGSDAQNPRAAGRKAPDAELLDARVDGEAVSFESTSFSVYVVVSTVLRQMLTASDGNDYLVTVSYDNTSGIPSDAELYVSEIKKGKAGYEEYVAQSAATLGEKPENLAFARPFDITLRNPRTGGECQPNGNVAVTIELLNDDLNHYASVDVVHIPDGTGKDARVMDSTVHGGSVAFKTNGFSVYVLTGFTVDFHWGDYTFSMAGKDSILLSDLLEALGIDEITPADVADAAFSDPSLVKTEKLEGVQEVILAVVSAAAGAADPDIPQHDWRLTSLAPFDTEETLLLTLTNGQTVEIRVLDEQENHNPKVAVTAGAYDPDTESIAYTVTLEAEGDIDYGGTEYPVTIADLTGDSSSDLEFVSGSYTYTHAEGFTLPEGSPASRVGGANAANGTPVEFTGFPLTVEHMYDGDTITLNYTARVRLAEYDAAVAKARVDNRVSITNIDYDSNTNLSDLPTDNSAEITTAFDYTPLSKDRTGLEGSWASWEISINPKGYTLNDGQPLTLTDNFNPFPVPDDETQSIDYASIRVTGDGVSYDYQSSTGTFVIPDNTAVTIRYRTRITASPGDVVHYGNLALLFAGDEAIDSVSCEKTDTIYPSASDVAGTTDDYFVKLYVYSDGQMQTGIADAQFILLDANRRPMSYQNESVIFTTGDDGYVDVRHALIEKNTAYYLEMIKAPEGWKKDTTLYNFMITDDPSYNSGGAWTYYNGDTVKVRLYPEEPGLNVSVRLSGNYDLTQEQQDGIQIILQKKNTETNDWEEVERHALSEFSYDSMTFEKDQADDPFVSGETYRVVQENQQPWDIPETIRLTSSYYLIIGSGDSENSTEPMEFTVTPENVNSSFNVVINNEYEEPKLEITKMNKKTGDKLPGAVFTVINAGNDEVVKTCTTDSSGKLEITGGSDYLAETLYYVVETEAPDGYLLPLEEKRFYFYFCNDPVLEPEILAQLPEGETAVNLSEHYRSVSLDNQQKELAISVMKTWQNNAWPSEVDRVEIALYQSVDGSEPTRVKDKNDRDLPPVVLSRSAPYFNHAFVNLPARDGDGQTINYSIQEEHIYKIDGEDILSQYVQEYGQTDAGVFIVRNKPATTLTVTKEWYTNPTVSSTRVTNEAVLAQQSDVTFDVYRTTEKMPEEGIRADGVTNEEMAAFVSGLELVRSDVTFGDEDNWIRTIRDLAQYDDARNLYYYYVMETIPSFGDEIYEPDEANGTVTIKNKVAPERVSLTVKLDELVDDPREGSEDRDFTFTLNLKKGTHDIRGYQVYDDGNGTALVTDRNGEVTFTLKPENEITLSLPAGVTATVTEEPHHEYTEVAASSVETFDNNVFSYDTSTEEPNVTVTFTNTLRVICKVVDSNGDAHPYESLASALAYIRSDPAVYVGGVATIQMLEDYNMPATDVFDVRADETITLTTAGTADDSFPFKTDRTEDTDRAIITRTAAGGSLFANEGTLSLEKVCLDGGGLDCAPAVGGGLVYSTGTLNLSEDTALRNSTVTGHGSAIYSTGIVNMTGGEITGNTGADDGAVALYGSDAVINLSGSPRITGNRNTTGDSANLYINEVSDSVINVVAPGLDVDAEIGVTAQDGNNDIGQQFATADFDMTANLSSFVNDQYGYTGKLKDGTFMNVVWDGLTLTIRKDVEARGANPNDTFTITLSSMSIRKSQYTIDGNLDNDVTRAGTSTPGTIVLRNVRADDVISISPLPAGSYTITEAASNYTPEYALGTEPISVDSDGSASFLFTEDSTVTVTNTRRLADVTLNKSMRDRLVAEDEAQSFPFKVRLTEADGTAVSGFELRAGETVIATTDGSGEADFNLSPTNTVPDTRTFPVPVGVSMTITETDNPSYTITSSAETGEGAAINDEDTEHGNIFTFNVTDAGAGINFSNVRNMAHITLSKELVNKVAAEEDFIFTVTLKNANGSLAKNFVMYEDTEHPENNITTDEDGKATIHFNFGAGVTGVDPIVLTIPEGTKLEIAETPVKKPVNGSEQVIYNTACTITGVTGTTGDSNRKATIGNVSGDGAITFTNTRKTNTVTVKNTVNGYAGNVVPFAYTATITGGDDYNSHGFTNGTMTFTLTTGQSQALTVPYGEELTITQGFIVGYQTTMKHGSASAISDRYEDVFTVTGNVNPVLFTNTQLIGLRIVNNTSSTLENVTVTVGKNNIYRVNDEQTGQTQISSNKTAVISVDAGKTAILEIQHDASATAEQNYTVRGTGPAAGYYYTIHNEPSFHEYADPTVLRIYDTEDYEVKGKLRYSVSDSIVTISEQPLVSFDVNGGVWTTEMEGYRWYNGVYQIPVDSGEMVARPAPDPVYSTAEGVNFLGWSENANSDNLYDFDSLVNAPLTLYAVWDKQQSDSHTVTLKNGTGASLVITVMRPTDVPDPGETSYTIPVGETVDLTVSDGATLVFEVTDAGLFAVSSEFTVSADGDGKFTIASVIRDGTVAFTSGICKITDGSGALLYDSSGNPAVYTTLTAAFTAYAGTLYTDADHTTSAAPAMVKMLVEEYDIETGPVTFPNATMTLTTAGKDDTDFPYVGVRDRSTLYRSVAGASAQCFTLSSGNITLTNIILDGGSEQGVKITKTKNGGLVYMNNASSVLNVTTGTTLRNCEFAAYDDGNNSRGGAIYMTNGTLNVSAGLFSNLHAYQGGAICVTGGTLNVTGTAGSTRFENCYSEKQDGGAVYYNVSKDLLIDGGMDKDDPGIVFTDCVAKYTNGTGDGSDGGAIFATSNYNNTVTVKGCSFIECSARTGNSASTSGFGGGGIVAYKVKGLTVEACMFDACDTLCGGGAVVAIVKYTETLDNETVSIINSSFDHCNCKGQGGALAVYQDDNTKTNSATKLTIMGSSFDGCSSGTNNGSGGAIQCYLPCMVFSNSDFTDCWAGKEGGAVNNFFASKFGDMWSKSSLTLIQCTFTRCRAEDRYQAEQMQHYGGAINTKVKNATVIDSTFIDCVSTLREGGALHLGGIGSGSTATITGSTFKNCMAKTGGGAVMASTETLTVSDSFFSGCQAFGKPESNYKYDNAQKKNQNGGGAISHSENSRNTSTQATTTITDCVFTSDPNGGKDAQSCSTATNGGAVWTRAKTVTIDGCKIDSCTAGGNGGGIYLSKNGSQNATISGGFITGCQAVKGSAVYVEDKATFSGINVPIAAGSEDKGITKNTVTDENSGAIEGSKLYFEGSMIVTGNTWSEGGDFCRDVALNTDSNTVIYTTSVGLSQDAEVGVYVADSNSAYDNHGHESQPFGTYGSGSGNAFLEGFFNDRDTELRGCQISGTLIYWGIYVCKITDADGNTLTGTNGRAAVYRSLNAALSEFTLVTNTAGQTGDAVYIKMLVENYYIQQESAISNFPNATVTLTTATRDQEPLYANGNTYPYRGTEGTVCTISRTNSDNALFRLSTATFRLENITLDGRRDKTTDTGDYRLIEAVSGSLVVNAGTTMQYGNAEKGGAVYAADSPVTVNGSYDAGEGKAAVQFIRCAATGTGGAIHADSLTINDSTDQYGTAFTECSAEKGGAVCVDGTTMRIIGAECRSCHSQYEGGAFYHDVSAACSTEILFCGFTDCYSGESGDNSSCGGAIASTAKTLAVESSRFESCHALSDGGAVCHIGNVDGTKTTLTNSTFINCRTTGTDADYSRGGAVCTQAMTTELIKTEFTSCTSYGDGGALYCGNDAPSSVTTVSGVSFDRCSVNDSNISGSGGAICSRNKTLTIQAYQGTETTIRSCTAPMYGGAVFMEPSGSSECTLNIKDNTEITGCCARYGGAIYLAAGVTMNLTDNTGSPVFSQNGYTIQGGKNAEAGTCIYLAQESILNLSGSPRFSRNNITTSRVTNGGTTDYIRQDIYLAGYEGVPEAASIHIAGELTGDTIWVWPEESPHRLYGEQFAKIDNSSVSAESLGRFRNARSDRDTNCSNGEFLAGVLKLGDTVNGYWGRTYDVSFAKIDNKGAAVPGAEFTLYTDSNCTNALLTAASGFGDGGSLGRVSFPSIPIGVYYMKETRVPESFHENNSIYLVLVGSPTLSPSDDSDPLWTYGGPLDVTNAAMLVQRQTISSGKSYGIFLLNSDGKAVLSANLAITGITNTRNDFEAYFMKLDGSGNPLPGAKFTIYRQTGTYDNGYPRLELWSREGEAAPAPVESADGTGRFKNLKGGTLPKGLVYFSELPQGEYYLVETYYPERNGNNRIDFFKENDRVLKLNVNGESGFTLSERSEWGGGSTDYTSCDVYTTGGVTYSSVKNAEVVCKLTDENDHLLYVLSADGTTRHPAIYETLQEGFEVAATGVLLDKNGNEVANGTLNPALKLKLLKDFTLSDSVTYTGGRPLTLTTAETKKSSDDRYIFNTTRTTNSSRAEIKQGLNTITGGNDGALITVGSTSLTLENISLNGQKATYNGRAIHVTQSGSLSILTSTLINYFKQEADSSESIKGGAILLDEGASLTVDGGTHRSAIISDNIVKNTGSGSANGGAIAAVPGSTIRIENAQMKKNYAQGTEGNGNGGAVSAEGMSLPIRNVVFSSNQATAYGGAVYVTGENASFLMNSGTISSNRADRGGAVYVTGTAAMTLKAGTFKTNTADTDGACLYLEENAKLYLSGKPSFGSGSSANTVTKEGYSDHKNGDESVYTGNKVRQDIYTAETGEEPGSIVITGKLTGADGSIWVWAESEHHHKQLTPFASFAEGVNVSYNAAQLKVFRNAQDDETTENGTDTWLYGSLGENPEFVYWTGVEGFGRVILRKVEQVDSTRYSSLAGKTFTVYKGASTAAFTPKGETKPLEDIKTEASGAIYVGSLPYGWYILKETNAGSSRFFYVVVDASGVYGTLDGDGNHIAGGFGNRDDADTAAAAKYSALRAATP